MKNINDAHVLSLGGSLVVPSNGIDTQFLSEFSAFIRKQISEKNRRFFLVVGGGSTTRKYQIAAQKVKGRVLDNDDLDWLGIHATRLNAHMVRVIFRDIAHSHVIKHYEVIRKVEESLIVAAGWKPGWSTDYCAVTLCQDYNIQSVINMTNVDQVYNKDPKKHKDAKPMRRISWKDYCKMAGDEWIPGLNLPFDPVASKLARDLSVKVRILNGKNLKNLALALDGKSFKGTTIK
ncbi:UMP kinase [Patescibacteria group bacterium]